tara:strand:- start:513 stop:860 length:348 start_codon:yes stop_codon:yes gene_type:complete
MRYGSLLNRYRNEPLFKYLFNDGVKTWYPILRKNYGIMMHHTVYADQILDLTMSGACPQDYLENHMDQDANLLMDDLKKDDKRLEHLNELDPSGENRKFLKHMYLGEDGRRKYGN